MTTLLAVPAFLAIPAARADGPKAFYNIPSGDAAKTLQIYLQQTRIEMIYVVDNVRGRHTHAVSGNLDATEALAKMLDGTDLVYEFRQNFSFATVRPRAEQKAGTAEPPRADVAEASVLMESRDETPTLKKLFGDVSLDEVTVTGSRIPGVVDMTSPLEVLTKKELRKTPYATVQDALRALPVNMGGTFNEVFGGVGNYARGVSANLRGLGSGGTLVLIDGRRQPYSGLQADFVDLSTIPWSAVERIEVLPDGASALYGSDAIAGVVNVIMRKDADGAETQARFGMALGGADERLVSQLFGTSWDNGSALIAYQYAERTNLPASARGYAADEDQRARGGTDHRSSASNPGNILSPATFLPAYAIPSGQDGTSLTTADLIPGVTNLENRSAGTDVLPDRKSHSLYLTASHKLGDRFELYGDARVNKTDTDVLVATNDKFLAIPATNPFAANLPKGLIVSYNFRDDLGDLDSSADVRSYAGTFGVKMRAGETWRFDLSGTRGSETLRAVIRNDVDSAALAAALADPNPATAFNPFGDGSSTNPATLEKIRLIQGALSRSQISAANLVADGTLMTWAMGPLRLAAGGEWRQETLERGLSTQGATVRSRSDFGRTVSSAFAELSVPLIGNPGDARAVPRLELSLAGRYEKYSDFGTTTNPKIGLKWVPLDSLKVRTSWGTSFKAPKLTDLYDSSQNASGLAMLRDPRSPAGYSSFLVQEGSNPDLHQEVAHTWTAGVDFAPRSVPGLTASLTYFSVNYDDRIIVPGPSPVFDMLLQENQWSSVINREPTKAQIDAVCEGSRYVTGTVAQCESASITGIIDRRVRNLAATYVRGVDLKIDHSFTTDAGAFDLGLNGSYVLSFRQASSSTSPEIDVLDTVGNPLALRVRATADWHQYGFDRPGFGASLAVDHFGSYRDVQILSQAAVSPLTTVDLKASYRTLSGNGTFDDMEFGLNGSNILNQAPPFVDRSAGFDVTNAVPYGRVISLSVQKRW